MQDSASSPAGRQPGQGQPAPPIAPNAPAQWDWGGGNKSPGHWAQPSSIPGLLPAPSSLLLQPQEEYQENKAPEANTQERKTGWPLRAGSDRRWQGGS